MQCHHEGIKGLECRKERVFQRTSLLQFSHCGNQHMPTCILEAHYLKITHTWCIKWLSSTCSYIDQVTCGYGSPLLLVGTLSCFHPVNLLSQIVPSHLPAARSVPMYTANGWSVSYLIKKGLNRLATNTKNSSFAIVTGSWTASLMTSKEEHLRFVLLQHLIHILC